MIKVLHLSDLHFHTKEEDDYHAFTHADPLSNADAVGGQIMPKPMMVDAILGSLRDEMLPIDAIIITGDLTGRAGAYEFTNARRAIERLPQKSER